MTIAKTMDLLCVPDDVINYIFLSHANLDKGHVYFQIYLQMNIYSFLTMS